MASKRQTIQDLANQLQARSGTVEVQLIKEWLSLRLETVKVDLMTATPETFQTVQGEARMLQQLIRQLERPSLNVRAE